MRELEGVASSAWGRVLPSRQLRKIPLMRPIVDEDMLHAVVLALQNEKLVLGESVYKFEEDFARYCGTRYAVSTGSGTAALQIALQSLAVGSGDDVLTSPFSFIASSNAVLHAGARPLFADVDGSDFNLDAAKVVDKLTPRTRAIIPVHLYGHPCKMEEFRDLTADKGIKLVEDACQAHGAAYNGRRVGSFGEAGCFSFYTSKNMTVCGDGGMIVTNDEEVSRVARSLRDCGRESKYMMSRIGYTSRLNTVNAAIGRVQLRRLDEWNRARQKIAELYRRELGGVEGIALPPSGTPREKPVYHLFVIRSRKRSKIAEWLERNGVESGVHYPVPIHLQAPYKAMFGYSEGLFHQSERLSREVLSLPMYPSLSEEEVGVICGLVREAVQRGA